LVEGTAGPGLAIAAMAGIGWWQAVAGKGITNSAAAAPTL
jgi:hypothetical protein